MNIILIRMLVASILLSIKNPKRKAELKQVAREIVLTILMVYADDPQFLDEDGDGQLDKPVTI